MKIAAMTVFVLLILIVAWLFIQGYLSRSGVAPGLESGRLATCPDKPNCVCSDGGSESDEDPDAFVAPILTAENNPEQVWTVIKEVIVEQGGQLQAEKGDYLAAIFVSSVFGFVDDLEVRLDSAQNLFHVRSASRVGHSDFGANRKRIEQLKKRIEEKLLGLSLIDRNNVEVNPSGAVDE